MSKPMITNQAGRRTVYKVQVAKDGYIVPNSLLRIQEFSDNNNSNEHEDGTCLPAGQHTLLDDSTTLIITDSVTVGDQGSGVCYVHLQLDSEGVPIKENCNDEELTSLSWLQSTDLLQSMKLPSSGTLAGVSDANKAADIKKSTYKADSGSAGSGSSVDDSEAESSWDGSNMSYSDVVLPCKPNVSFHLNGSEEIPDGRKAVASKPPHSFSTLIFLAIESSEPKALPVRDIYSWITKHFIYYRSAPAGWKNSVRHNLSLNKCFCKVDRGPNVGKGSLWMVDPLHRPQLLQSLCKVPHLKVDLLQRLINEKPDMKRMHDQRQTETKVLVQDGRSHATPSKTPPSPSLRSNVPDPKLFPYLSRRLANSGADNCHDVDAATAMLALGQGDVNTFCPPSNASTTPIPPPKKEYSLRKPNREELVHSVAAPRLSHSTAIEPERTNQTSPSDDHTYSFSTRHSRVTRCSGAASKRLHFHCSPEQDPVSSFEDGVIGQGPEVINELEVETNEDSLDESRPCKQSRVATARPRAKDRLRARGRGKVRSKVR